MALRAKKPEAVEKRLKLFLFGDYGVGKTTAALQFGNAYVIDCERGAENKQYVDLMTKRGSVYFASNDVDEITDELRSLLREKHTFKTVILDPITALESDLIEKASRKYPGEGDMRIWRDRDAALRRISSLLLKLDMNIIVTAHGKVDYGPNMTKLGTTFDGWKRWPYLFDVVAELKRNGKDRTAVIRKSRVLNFADGEEFPWSYEEFQKRYGSIIEKEAAVFVLASAESVAEARRLVDLLKVEEDTVSKWHTKQSAEGFEEYSEEAIQKVILFCRKTIDGDMKPKGA